MSRAESNGTAVGRDTKAGSDRPDLATLVVDKESDDSRAVVVQHPPCQADEWDVYGRGTVAEDNPEYPSDDPVVTVVYKDDLDEFRPYYSGVQPIEWSNLNDADLNYYHFPASRLEVVGSQSAHEVPVERLHPAPYHARSFSYSANEDFVDLIAQAGEPPIPPLVRVLDDGFQIINGHKRVWASAVAGIEAIDCWTFYTDDENAARAWANRHLEEYDGESYAVAYQRLRENFGTVAQHIATTATNEPNQTETEPEE